MGALQSMEVPENPVELPWEFHGIIALSHGTSMILPWGSHGFIVLGHGTPMGLPWNSDKYPNFHGVYGLPWISHGTSRGFSAGPWDFHGAPMGLQC